MGCANKDREQVIIRSTRLGFLTGRLMLREYVGVCECITGCGFKPRLMQVMSLLSCSMPTPRLASSSDYHLLGKGSMISRRTATGPGRSRGLAPLCFR